MSRFKKFLLVFTAVLIVTFPTWASVLHVWASGDTLRSADLNYNFNYILTHMVGGQGARLVDGDVATTAGISHSKLQYPALLPKGWAYVDSCTCGSTADTVSCTFVGQGVLAVKSSGTTGVCKVYMNYTVNNANAGALTTSNGGNPSGVFGLWTVGPPGTNHISVKRSDFSGTGVDAIPFTVVVFDDDSGP